MRDRFAVIWMLRAVTPLACSGCLDPAPEALPQVVLPHTVQHLVESEILDRTYSVQVALPRGYEDGGAQYPVLYMLDANWQFGMVVDIVRGLTVLKEELEIPELIVVGIGYPVDYFYDALGMRMADLSPARDTAYERIALRDYPDIAGDRETGGGPRLLRFLTEEAAPQIEARYRIDSSDRAILGHSLGGQFALFSLFEEPAFFSRYLAVSPSLWWNCHPDTTQCWGEAALPGRFFEREGEFHAAGGDLDGRLFLAVGLGERPHMVESANRLADRLATGRYPALRWTLAEFEGETHMSVVPGAVAKGLRWLYSEGGGH
jgi:predicted alpha/beta superfamily hydrolase